MSTVEVLRSLRDRYKIARWIGGTRNLALLRRRMHAELERSEAFHAYKLWAVLVLLLWRNGTGSRFLT